MISITSASTFPIDFVRAFLLLFLRKHFPIACFPLQLTFRSYRAIDGQFINRIYY